MASKFFPAYIVAGDMSGVVTGPPVLLDQYFGYCFSSSWTGVTAAGTLKLQATNTPLVAGSWEDVAGSALAVAGAGSNIWNISSVSYLFVRQVFTPTSGTGVLNSNVLVKNTWV